MSLDILVTLWAALQLVKGCTLNIGAHDPDENDDGEMVEVGTLLGEVLQLRVLWLVNGFLLHDGTCNLDGGADGVLAIVGALLGLLQPLRTKL